MVHLFKGFRGFKGLKGFKGFRGFKGLKGFKGVRGFKGLKGFMAFMGLAAWLGVPLFADEPGSIVVDAKPGTCWQADWRWTEQDMPLTALVHPRITAWDAKGRKIFDRDVGRRPQRVYDPKCPADIKWRVYVTIGDGQKKVRGSLHALHTVDLPKTTVRFGLSVRRYGDDAILTNLTCTATLLADIPKPPRSSYPNIDESGCRILSDAELDAALSAREYLRPKLAVHGDRTELVVNGKVVVPKILKGADRLNANRYPAISLHAQDGFNIFTVGFQFNESAFPAQAAAAGIWRPDGSCDMGKIRLGLRECLRRNPTAMVMMVLSVAPYNGWGERHPSEIYRDEKGRYGVFTGCRVTAFHDRPEWNYAKSEYPAVSYASETFADEAAAFVEKMFRELERLPETKNVIGVYVNGGTDTQWLDLFDNRVGGRQAVDRSDVACRRFAEYRRRKYGRDDIEVKIPPDADFWTDDRQFYSEHEPTVLSDYREFLAQATTQMRLKISRAVKRGSGGRLLTGSYSPAGGLSGFPLISQTFTAGLLASDDFDFFAVVPGYTREHVDPVLSAIYDGSCLQRGKLYISELDLRSSEVLHWGVWGSDFWRENHDAHTFRRKTLSFAANAFVHGGTYHAYDLNNAWFATPGGRAAWRAAAGLARIVRPMPLTDERIALVGGERFFDFQSFGKSRTFPYLFRELPRVALAFSGVPWNCYLLDDVLASGSSTLPKVIVFTDLSEVTHERYNEIRRRWANSGRVLVWMHRPGVFAKDGEKIERDLGLAPAPDAYGKLPFADGSSDDPLMAGVKGTVMAMHPSYHYAKSDLLRPLPEKGWKTLANFAATDIPALAVRRTEGLVEVYASVPGGITPQLCRNLAREAGFRPVVESNDISGFGSGILYVLAQTSGEKVFRLPKGTSPGKVVEGPAYRACGDGFVVELKRGDLFILEVR